MANKTIHLTVNGASRSLEIDTRSRLVDVIRDKMQLTGTHVGCGTGNCGACTVFLDGRTAKSCCALAVDVDGCSVITIEGIANPDHLHPVQQAFIDNHGLQCGFCTPGMILSTLQLMEENPAPDDDEIRNAIAGNICRCTGYVNIVASIKDAARRLSSSSAK
jgi:aerobic carbon-monoxide dehydrogenase small subunit